MPARYTTENRKKKRKKKKKSGRDKNSHTTPRQSSLTTVANPHHKMSAGVRRLAVLGEFKPFGLIAEALDGKPADNSADKYDYFLFDPEVTRDRNEADELDASGDALSDRSDHELFIRGNR